MLRREVLDNGIRVSVIPRMRCIRIVSEVTIDPTIDLTIYPSDGTLISDKSSKQYLLLKKNGEKSDVSFNDITESLISLNRINEIR